MALDEQRAKDLASIEPPGSINKIVEFTQQLSFGQEALFAGTELPRPRIGAAGFASEEMSRTYADKPYSLFPGANGEGLDTLMSRYTIRSRDIQDFTRWLGRWNETRTRFLVFESPEQYFLHRASPQMIEAFQESPEVQRVILQGKRRTRVVQEEAHETVVEERVVKVHRDTEVRNIEQEVVGPESARPRKRFGGHPKGEVEEPNGREYWKEEPRAEAPKPRPRLATREIEPEPIEARAVIGSLNRGVMTSNIGLGSLAFGVVRGRSDATAAFQAQSAASEAVQGSPVSHYMVPQAGFGQPASGGPWEYPHAPPFQQGIPPAQAASHFPPPEVTVRQTSPRQIEITTDWPGAPNNQYKIPEPQLPEGYVLVQEEAAKSKGLPTKSGMTQSPSAFRGAAAIGAGGFLLPSAFAGGMASPYAAAPEMGQIAYGPYATMPGPSGPVPIPYPNAAFSAANPQQPFSGARAEAGASSEQARAESAGPRFNNMGIPLAMPGFTGAAASAFAGGIAGRPGRQGQSGQIAAEFVAGSDGGKMPPGSLPRKDMFSAGLPGEVAQPMLGGPQGPEMPVKTPITANPLMGQITVVSPPVRVASRESEQAGSAVSFNVKDLAKKAPPLDAAGLAALKQSLPPGAQAIYPALPPGSLGPQAVNMNLAPSLLSQILTKGYGPQAGPMANDIASMASATMPAGGGPGPLAGNLVPTAQRPTDAAAGVLAAGAGRQGDPLSKAGAANSSRGGPLDFLGMPVRLAPSLAGSTDVKHAVEAQKVLPAGASAVMRPNDFGAMRSKLFPGISSVTAEPDKAAWQKAAPSFGLRDTAPHTLLSPDSRIKPPTESGPLPQLHGGGSTLLSHALDSAAHVAPVAAAAMGPHFHMPGGAAVERASESLGGAGQGLNFGSHLARNRANQGGLGHISTPSFGHRPRLGMPTTRPASFSPSSFGGPRGGGRSFPSGATAAAASSSRVASRFSPSMSSIGTGPSATVHESRGMGHFHQPMHAEHGHGGSYFDGGAIPMAAPGGARSPGIPPVLPSQTPAMPTMGTANYSSPSMARPAMPTTAGSTPHAGSSGTAPSISSFARPASPSTTMSSMTTSGLASRAPSMPMVASVPATAPRKQSNTVIQRAEPGGAVHANRNEHPAQTHHSENTEAQDPGASAYEIGMLANEVWSILKRKMVFESERLGKRY